MEGLLSTGPTQSSFTKDDSVTELMNYKGICRTGPVTPGLLNIPNFGSHSHLQITVQYTPQGHFRIHYTTVKKVVMNHNLFSLGCHDTGDIKRLSRSP